MSAGKAEPPGLILLECGLKSDARSVGLDRDVVSQTSLDPELCEAFADERSGLVILAADDDRRTVMDDRRLFRRDLGERLSEVFLVVKIYLCDRSDLGSGRRGRVKPAAEPGLEYRESDSRFGKCGQSDRRDLLEKCRAPV